MVYGFSPNIDIGERAVKFALDFLKRYYPSQNPKASNASNFATYCFKVIFEEQRLEQHDNHIPKLTEDFVQFSALEWLFYHFRIK